MLSGFLGALFPIVVPWFYRNYGTYCQLYHSPFFYKFFPLDTSIPHMLDYSYKEGGVMPIHDLSIDTPTNLNEVNPLKQLRLKLNLSQKEVAEYAGMTPGAVVKYEQGLYEEPSDELLHALASCAFVDEPDRASLRLDLIVRYGLFRKFKRSQAKTYWPPGLWGVAFSNTSHPMVQFRELVTDPRTGRVGISAQGLCIMLCIHPSVLAKYEAGRVRNMPGMLSNALSEGGLDPAQTSIIQRFGESYYDRVAV